MSNNERGLSWRKSSKSAQSNCVEVARTTAGVFIRDSKDHTGPMIGFAAPSWGRFLAAVDAGAFDER